jgi:hypothetical protein
MELIVCGLIRIKPSLYFKIRNTKWNDIVWPNPYQTVSLF